MQYLVSKDNFTKITEPKGTLQNISRTLTIEVSNTQTENSGVLLPPMCKIQFDGDSVYVRCVDGAGAEARVIPFEVVVKGGDGGGTDFSLDQAGTTIVEDFKFSALEYPNATNPNLDGKTVLVMSVKDANETTQLVKYVFVDLAKLVGTSTLYKPSDNAIGISGASIGVNLSASAGNILSVADDGLYGWLGVAGGVSGNFAILSESGAIIDGGFSFADFVTPDFTGATSITGGLNGLVPAPQAGDNTKFLRGDGSWVIPTDTNTTYSVATTSDNGLMSAADKTKLDRLENYTLPTASTSTKGGVVIGGGLSMNGDTLQIANSLLYDTVKYARSPFDSANIVGLDLSHLVNGTNFGYETLESGEVRIRSGSSSFNRNNGSSRGYVEVTTTRDCIVKVTYSISSEKVMDLGGCIVSEGSPNTTFTIQDLKSANFFVVSGALAKRTATYALDADKTYYLNFGYLKDDALNLGDDRFYIYEISIMALRHADKDVLDYLFTGTPTFTGNPTFSGNPTLSGNPTFTNIVYLPQQSVASYNGGDNDYYIWIDTSQAEPRIGVYKEGYNYFFAPDASVQCAT